MRIYRTIYEIGMKNGLDMEKIQLDKTFLKAMQGLEQIIENEFIKKIDKRVYNLHAVSKNEVVGTILIEGDELEPGKLKLQDSIRMIEKRIIEHRCTFYIFIITRARLLGKQKQDKRDRIESNNIEELIYKNRCMIDATSRSIDYYLDICNNETSIMTELCKRDNITSSSPEIVLLKMIILYNLPEYKNVINMLPTDGESIYRNMVISESLIYPNSRTDWLYTNTFTSADKAAIFEPQLSLAAQIEQLAKDLSEEDNFEENYINLINGDMYNLSNDEYNWINKFIALGSNAFSTKALNTIWKQHI